jgi:hypothetical protein
LRSSFGILEEDLKFIAGYFYFSVDAHAVAWATPPFLVGLLFAWIGKD